MGAGPDAPSDELSSIKESFVGSKSTTVSETAGRNLVVGVLRSAEGVSNRRCHALPGFAFFRGHKR